MFLFFSRYGRVKCVHFRIQLVAIAAVCVDLKSQPVTPARKLTIESSGISNVCFNSNLNSATFRKNNQLCRHNHNLNQHQYNHKHLKFGIVLKMLSRQELNQHNHDCRVVDLIPGLMFEICLFLAKMILVIWTRVRGHDHSLTTTRPCQLFFK